MILSEYTDHLLKKLSEMGFPEKEYIYRENALKKAAANTDNTTSEPCNRYYNLAHEIKCLDFLRQFGTVSPSCDSGHIAGCDVILNGHYSIEFVCTSPGENREKSGFNRFSVRYNRNLGFFDYSEKERFLFSRITGALEEKRKFYEDHLKQNTISPDKPYLVFIGLGSLAIEMFTGDYGMELTGVLLGKGKPTITIDGDGKVIGCGYSHNETFLKYNGASLDCNIFCRPKFQCISGVFFSEATLCDDYNTKNTWLFLNPFSNAKVCKKDFPGIVYWSADKNGKYQPRRRGHII